MTDQPANLPPCDYLARKKVKAYGIKITPPDGIKINPFQIPATYTEPDPSDPTGKKKRRYLPPVPPSSLVIPLHDTSGKFYMVQFILDKAANAEWIAKNNGQDKIYWPPGGQKQARFFSYGGIPYPGGTVLIGEGYATMATAHEATGLPIIVACDANNIEAVLKELLPYYPQTHFLILADDDDIGQCIECKEPLLITQTDGTTCPQCNKLHQRTNAGIRAAMRACFDPRIKWIAPKFKDNPARLAHYRSHKGKLTDFNDLFQLEGLITVQKQVESALNAQGWQAHGRSSGHQPQGGGGNGEIQAIASTAECLNRYSLIYAHKQTVFDHYNRILLPLADMRDACQHRDVYTRWAQSEYRKIYQLDNVGFDPSGDDDNIKCNTYDGWPTEPKQGDCQIALDLLDYLCSKQGNRQEVYEYILKWIAYIIQHPGAKMRSALTFHGPQGTGKNLFWEEIVMPIFGKYSLLIGQDALEDKHNDFASSKLLVIADEVVARYDLQHVKNKLKYYITCKTIRINPKNIAAYNETNHMNFVFNANGILPQLLELGDRRHGVVWTPEKLSKDFYYDVGKAIEHKGLIEAFHWYLLNEVDLTGFNEFVEPPMTDAKQDVIELSQSSPERFCCEWLDGQIEDMPANIPIISMELYEVYKYWCRLHGFTPHNSANFIGQVSHMRGVAKTKPRRYTDPRFDKYQQARFIVPPNAKISPPGGQEQYFLWDCVQEFREYLNALKGKAYDT